MPRRSRKNKKYSVELKTQAVKDWNEGKGSQYAICRKYGILSIPLCKIRFYGIIVIENLRSAVVPNEKSI